MFVKLAVLPTLFLLLAAQNAAENQAKQDLKALQGTWVMANLEVNGKDVPTNKIANTTVIIEGEKYTTHVKEKRFPCTIRLDAKKDPREIDMIFAEPGGKDKVQKGIYKIENDTLKIARGLSPEQARPNQFATWPDTNYFVVTWKRQ